jgi:hypothetical protein
MYVLQPVCFIFETAIWIYVKIVLYICTLSSRKNLTLILIAEVQPLSVHEALAHLHYCFRKRTIS